MNYNQIETYILDLLANGLDNSLHYHGVHHTIEVIDNVKIIARNEGISGKRLELLKLAALMHDAGFLNIYNGHEVESCQLSKEILPNFGVSKTDIEQICGMIMATKLPQTPHNLLEKVIADADLMYLGTDKFVTIGDTLFEELKENNLLNTRMEWNTMQVQFLTKHTFHTKYCIENLSKKKQENLDTVNKLLLTK
jgi:uncharacterized protein